MCEQLELFNISEYEIQSKQKLIAFRLDSYTVLKDSYNKWWALSEQSTLFEADLQYMLNELGYIVLNDD